MVVRVVGVMGLRAMSGSLGFVVIGYTFIIDHHLRISSLSKLIWSRIQETAGQGWAEANRSN